MNIAAVRDGDDGLNLKTEDQLARMNIKVQQRLEKQRMMGAKDTKEAKVRNPRTPYHMNWVADIIKPFMIDHPDISYSEIKKLLSLYAREYVITDTLCQDAKRVAKEELFGSANENAKYANAVVSELVAMGHHAQLQFSSRKVVNSRIGIMILMEESLRRKTAGERQLEGKERNTFVTAWKEKHAIDLDSSLGLADGPQHRFLTGICFSTPTHSKGDV